MTPLTMMKEWIKLPKEVASINSTARPAIEGEKFQSSFFLHSKGLVDLR